MKLIVAGGRSIRLNREEKLELIKFCIDKGVKEIVSGCAHGVDTCAIEFATYFEYHCSKFQADWNKYGNAAGAIRNKEMAKYADAVLLFPGGKGTANMESTGIKLGLEVYKWEDNSILQIYNQPKLDL
jgi:hypothetical protein